jgi:hypothetical protein
LALWRLGTVGLWLASLAGILLYVARDRETWGLFLDILFNNHAYPVRVGPFIAGFFANQYDDVSACRVAQGNFTPRRS